MCIQNKVHNMFEPVLVICGLIVLYHLQISASIGPNMFVLFSLKYSPASLRHPLSILQVALFRSVWLPLYRFSNILMPLLILLVAVQCVCRNSTQTTEFCLHRDASECELYYIQFKLDYVRISVPVPCRPQKTYVRGQENLTNTSSTFGTTVELHKTFVQ